LISLLADVSGDGHEVTQGRGFHSFGHRVAVKDTTGVEVGSVMWGGMHGDLSMIEVKGEPTPRAVKQLRERFFHKVTRVDACADFDAPRAFEKLLEPCMEVKAAHRLKGERRGDWEDFPEEGRTLYLGAATSVARVRLYEKGKQPEYRHLSRNDWARIEVQVRPAKEAKGTYAHASPSDVWGATRWTRDLAARALQAHVDPHPAGTVYRETDLERRLTFCAKQYGPTFLELFEAVGSWECVGLTLREKITQLKEQK
jgi:hypothetical protein